jgi:hypothetical protein
MIPRDNADSPLLHYDETISTLHYDMYLGGYSKQKNHIKLAKLKSLRGCIFSVRKTGFCDLKFGRAYFSLNIRNFSSFWPLKPIFSEIYPLFYVILTD